MCLIRRIYSSNDCSGGLAKEASFELMNGTFKSQLVSNFLHDFRSIGVFLVYCYEARDRKVIESSPTCNHINNATRKQSSIDEIW